MNIVAIMKAYNELTVIHWLVVKLEGMFPGAGQGATKLNILLNTVQSGADAVVNVAQVSAQAGQIVSAYKTAGAFPDASVLPPLVGMDNPLAPSALDNQLVTG